jgi:hypothetical protein
MMAILLGLAVRSPQVGETQAGEVLEVSASVQLPNGSLRVQFEKGWTSVASGSIYCIITPHSDENVAWVVQVGTPLDLSHQGAGCRWWRADSGAAS